MTNQLITDNLFFADILAGKFKRKISFVSYEELQSAAYLGLVEAANNFDSSKNTNFTLFARFRIVGAIRDYLREISWGSRRNCFAIASLDLAVEV